MLVIQQGLLVDAAGRTVADLALQGGQVAALSVPRDDWPPAAQLLDATGHYLLPGPILFVHGSLPPGLVLAPATTLVLIGCGASASAELPAAPSGFDVVPAPELEPQAAAAAVASLAGELPHAVFGLGRVVFTAAATRVAAAPPAAGAALGRMVAQCGAVLILAGGQRRQIDTAAGRLLAGGARVLLAPEDAAGAEAALALAGSGGGAQAAAPRPQVVLPLPLVLGPAARGQDWWRAIADGMVSGLSVGGRGAALPASWLAQLHQRGVVAGRIALEQLVAVLAERPAAACGIAGKGRLLPGAAADVVVLDPERAEPHRAEPQRSGAEATPSAAVLRGAPREVFRGGRRQDGTAATRAPGRWLSTTPVRY